MTRTNAVILDIDGTLILSNDAHAEAWVDVGRELGHDIPFEKVRPLIGMGGDKVLPALTGLEEDSTEGKRMLERRGEIFVETYLATLKPAAGARELLQRFRDEGMKLVVATSARGEEMQKLLEQAGVADLVEDATSASDADASKPEPDIVAAALEKTGCPAAEVRMIGDTPYDVEAARRAGVAIVGVRSGGWNDAALAGALAVYDDPADLLRHYERSPFAR
jgi:HAD superfamily hydrolase (TIGR01509 family)